MVLTAARCTARHGVGSHAVPPTIECAIPTGKKFARHRPETASCATSVLPHSTTSNASPGRWLAVHGLQQQLVASRVEVDSSAVCSCWIRRVDQVMINSSSAACGA